MNFRSAGAVVLIAVVIVLVAGSLVADRLGAPADLVTTLVLCVAVAGLAFAGLSARTMKPSVFQAGGRTLSAITLLSLTTTLLLALASVRTSSVSVLELSGLAAACAGLLAYSTLVAEPLRRIAGQTFADALHARFASGLLTGLAGLISATLLTALALWMAPASVAAIVRVAGVTPEAARITALALCALVILPGGLAGIAGAALLAAGAVATSWLAPALPAVFASAQERTHWLDRAQETFHAASMPGPGWLLLALAAAGLFTLINPASGARETVSAARVSRLAVLAAAGIAFLGVFAQEVTRQRVEAIQASSAQSLPPMLFEDRFRGLVRLCGSPLTTPEDVKRICAQSGFDGPLPREAIVIDTSGARWHAAVLGIPAAAGEGFVLAVPLLLLVGLALACHAAAATLSHDLLRRFLLPPATAGTDLALRRLTGLGMLGLALYGPAQLPDPDPRLIPALLFAAASVPLPLMILARWRRADWRAALACLSGAFLAGTAQWFGLLEGPMGAAIGVFGSLATGALAALVFPASDEAHHAVAVMNGAVPGPLVLERSA